MKLRIASYELEFNKQNVRVANQKYEWQFKNASCKSKIRVENKSKRMLPQNLTFGKNIICRILI